MKPFRLRVQESLTARLEEIATDHTGGPSFNLAGKVFRGRQYFGDDTTLPFVSILEEPIAAEADFSNDTNEAGVSTYALMVQGFVDDNKDNPTDDAHYLMADVKDVLAQIRVDSRETDRVLDFPSIAPTVTAISFGGGVVRPADEVSAVAYFWLRVVLTLVEDHDDSYA